MQPCTDAYKAATGANTLLSVILNMSMSQPHTNFAQFFESASAAGVCNIAKHCLTKTTCHYHNHDMDTLKEAGCSNAKILFNGLPIIHYQQ